MDNDAFRALVQERSRAKSSKEIAREAVEEEFEQRKRKRSDGGASRRRKGGSEGYSSESDGDGDGRTDYGDSDDDDDKKKKSSDIDSNSLKPSSKKQCKSSKYRDRAKERREGTNSDYEAAQKLLAGISSSAVALPPTATAAAAAAAAGIKIADDDENAMDATALSKYLGGDEAHTHLVKGLDVALARRIKHEIRKKDDDESSGTVDLDKLRTVALQHYRQRRQHEEHIQLANTPEDALEFIELSTSKSMSTELGQSMLTYLQRTRLPKKKNTIEQEADSAPGRAAASASAAGLAIQRSNLVFSAQPRPSDVMTAWETPREIMQGNNKKNYRDSATAAHAEHETHRPATGLDCRLINRIKNALNEHRKNDFDGDIDNANDLVNKNQSPSEAVPSPQLTDEDKSSVSGYSTSKAAASSSDEEDIFANAGEYTAPSGQSLSERENGQKQKEADPTKKGSIFSGLMAPTATTSKASSFKTRKIKSGTTSQVEKKGASLPSLKSAPIVDRDVLGARPSHGDKRSENKVKVQGVSVAYMGGYGEEMDVDFDGRFADDDKEEESKKKSGRDELTTGMKEYGQRGGGGQQHMSPDDF